MQSTYPINILDILCQLDKGVQLMSRKDKESYSDRRLLPWFLKVDDGLCNCNLLLTNWGKYGLIRTD